MGALDDSYEEWLASHHHGDDAFLGDPTDPAADEALWPQPTEHDDRLGNGPRPTRVRPTRVRPTRVRPTPVRPTRPVDLPARFRAWREQRLAHLEGEYGPRMAAAAELLARFAAAVKATRADRSRP